MMYVSLSLFLLFFILVGIYAGKNFEHKSSEGYFMADRQLNKWVVGISTAATANSGFIVVAAVGTGYNAGLSSLLYPLAWLMGDLVFWFLFAERIRNNKMVAKSVTIPQVLAGESTTNNKVQVVASFIILALLLVYTATQFIAAAKVVSSFSDIPKAPAMIISFIFVIAYSVWGGFKSSVWTDVVQGVMVLLLTLGLIIWGVYTIGGISSLASSIEAEGAYFSNFMGGKDFWFALVFVAGYAFSGFGFSISQPQITTRIFAASSTTTVKNSKWIYLGFVYFSWLGMCFIGIIAKIIMPELEDGEKALPMLAVTYFPDYIVGIVFACMLAAILSSVDSLLVCSSSALMIDMGGDRMIPAEKKILMYRVSIIFLGFISLIMALSMEVTVFGAVLFVATILAASIGSAMVLIILDLTKSHVTILIAILTGLLVAITWRLLDFQSIISDGLVGFTMAMIISLGYEKIMSNKCNA
jgi:sodium/proline symporter